ncbi:hypothetical protein AB0I10_34480 [Streptomyces sp. NPDC050636]|uniref:hypothetical protein n=1 Tax=Streptomyces sp. NPDC050636 TaxID=3154510 RepID=UPI003414B23F
MYRLRYDPAADAVHEALPPAASEELTLALAEACQDPLGATAPYGEDDKYVRMILGQHVTAVILIGHTLKTITVLQVSYLG